MKKNSVLFSFIMIFISLSGDFENNVISSLIIYFIVLLRLKIKQTCNKSLNNIIEGTYIIYSANNYISQTLDRPLKQYTR